jgi:HEAT repeat protein/beta-lactamase regulating signal transducer with metallopeptidase domain
MSSLAITQVLDAGLRATIVLGAAAVAALALRRGSAAARHFVWTLGLVAALTLPLVGALVPAWKLPLLPAPETLARLAPAPAVGSVLEAPAPRVRHAREAPPASVAVLPEPTVAPRAAARVDFAARLGQLWLAGALLVVLPLVVGTARVLRSSRRSASLDSPAWNALLREVAGTLGLSRPVRLLRGGPRAMPMALGMFRPAVLLPEDCETWSDERRRTVLTHELAHVKRLDCLTQSLAHVACALYWFHPLAWLAARRLRIERERACDDLVLRVGASGPDYADELLQLARSLRASPSAALAGVAMARPSQLEGRLLAILDPRLERRAPSRRAAAASAALAAGFLVPVAAVEPWSQPSFGLRTDVVESTFASSAGPAPAAAPSTRAPRPSAAAEPQARPEPEPEREPEAEDEAEQEPAQSAAPAHDERVVKALTGALSDSDAQVRKEAVFALGKLRAAGSARAIAAALQDSDAEVRQQAAFALGQLRSEVSVNALIGALEDKDAEVRQQAVFALGQIRSPGAAKALAGTLADASAEVRQQAVFALGQLRDPGSASALSAALKDSDPDVRQQAAFALGQLRDPNSAAALAAALKDSDADVRQQAAFALGQLRHSGSVGALAGALKDSDADVRQQAAFALGQIRSKDAVPALLEMLKADKNADIRQQAAFALGQIGDERALEAITAALKDADADVRRQAAHALGQLTR